ncbi:hypothetical protein BJ742DRAFT_857226 [Cladochytrium replicatum]|nr:hypothetical protein BJ742DRAFT_857226 [Cladochytrium replicatum]
MPVLYSLILLETSFSSSYLNACSSFLTRCVLSRRTSMSTAMLIRLPLSIALLLLSVLLLSVLLHHDAPAYGSWTRRQNAQRRAEDAYVDIDGAAVEVPPPYRSYDDVSVPARAPPRYRFPRPKRYPVTRCVAIFILGEQHTDRDEPQYPDKPYLKTRRVYALKGRKGRSRLFAGSRSIFRMFSNETGNALAEELVFDGHGGMAVDSTAVFPHRGMLFTGGRDKVVNIWATTTSRPCNGTVYSGSLDGTVRMYDAYSGVLLHVFNHTDALVKEYGISTGYPYAPAAIGITAIAVVPDHGGLFTMNALNDVREWSTYTGKMLRKFGLLAEPELNPRGIAVDGNYTWLYAGDARNTNSWPLLYGIYEYDIIGDDGGIRTIRTNNPNSPPSTTTALSLSLNTDTIPTDTPSTPFVVYCWI